MKRKRMSWKACAVAGLMCALVTAWWYANVRAPKLYAARGTFYFGIYGGERIPESADWSGPAPYWVFSEYLWDKRPDDFAQRVLRRLHEKGMDTSRASEAEAAIQSMAVFRRSRTFMELVAVSQDPVLAADVANASMDVLYELDLEHHKATRESMIRQLTDSYETACQMKDEILKRAAAAKSEEQVREVADQTTRQSRIIDDLKREISIYQGWDVRTNTMFKVMIPADVATDVVTGKIARRLREHPTGLSPWCDREGNLVQNLLRQAAQIFHFSP